MGRHTRRYMRDYASRSRTALIADMGGACVLCGSWDELEFDHTGPRRWVARKVNRWQRVILYRRDWLAGELRLLCKVCHVRPGRKARGAKRV